MDIKVGEYVRTSKGYIFKIRHNKMVQGLKFLDAQYGTITKHSFNLIDLIEVGDFVNVYLVTDKYLFAGEEPVLETIGEDTNCKCMCEQDIQTILTREQYNQNCYKVKGENV